MKLGWKMATNSPAKTDIGGGMDSPKTPKTPKSNVQKTSKVWDYFIVLDENTVKCTKCGQTLTKVQSSTSNMNKHLKSVHGIGEPKQSLFSTPVKNETPAKNRIDNYMTTPRKDLPKMSKNCPEYNRITDKVADYIIDSQRPLNTVDEKPFINMCEELNPRYSILFFSHTIIIL